MANSPIVSSLPAYVEERRLPLVAKAILGGKVAKVFTLQSGIKSKAKINLVDTSIVFGDGKTCGWSEAGTTTLSQREIATGNIKINMAFCDKAMLDTWAQYEVRIAAGQKVLPFEDEFVENILARIQEAIDVLVFQGDTAVSNTNPNTNKADGLIKILGAETSTPKVSLTSATTYFEYVNAVVAAIPAAVRAKGDVAVFVGYDTYYGYQADVLALNLYHYDVKADGDEMLVAGTNIRLIPVGGLNGTNNAIAGSLSNMFYGCDLADDSEIFRLWYSEDNGEFRFRAEFNVGTNVAYPDEVVLGSVGSGGSLINETRCCGGALAE